MSHGTGKKPVAVFISQLRTLDDLTGLFPPDWHDRVRRAREEGPGFIAGPAFDIKGQATGHLVLLLRSAAEIMASKGSVTAARQLIEQMTRFAAEQLYGDVIGLGSLTTSITRGGTDVVDFITRERLDISATHGDAGSVMAITECIREAALQPDVRIAVVGAYGVIGTALCRYLAKAGYRLTAVGRSREKLTALVDMIRKDGAPYHALTPTDDIGCVRHADCVVTVTSATDALITPGMLKRGAVVIDPSVPANVAPGAGWLDPAHDNIVISNASQVRLLGVRVTSGMFGTFDDPDGCQTSYACFAETLVQAMQRDRRHHVGEIDLGYVETLRGLYKGYGFGLAVPRMFGSAAWISLRGRLAVA